MDDPIMLVLIAVAVLAVAGVFLAVSRKKSKASGNDKETRANKGKKGGKAQSRLRDDEDEEEDDRNTDGNWDWGAAPAANVVDNTKVSVQDVDTLTEFNVYKQFGYFDKAAESLTAYLDKTQSNDKELASELVNLWLQAGNPDAAAETMSKYQNLLSDEEFAKYIKEGLALDENHLGLRVLAESKLGWSVKKTAEEIGEKTGLHPEPEAAKQAPTPARTAEKAKEESRPRKALVAGKGSLSDISTDEKGAVLAFMNPEQSVKLLKDSLSYDAAVKYLNKAIRRSKRPASLLIDALSLDYRARNINGFAGHLWNLYYTLGQYGRQVKERMLGWGYTMGSHPVFDRLEAAPNEAALRDLGIQQGWLDGGSLKKARYQALVTETSDANAEPRTAAERILKESESLLMYGQLDNSMDLLEKAIVEHPQESQLYIALFDLYERAEEWDRLERLLQELRPKVQTLPEEVVLAMSQLLQRFSNGSIGYK